MKTDERLRHLSTDGRRLLTEEFLKGESDEVSREDLQEFLELEPSGIRVDLGDLDEALEEIMGVYSRYDADIDAAAAPAVHRHIDIPRRVAADSSVWHYLAVVRYPDFVRYRWEFSTKNAMTEKFLGAGTDIYSNALHRLWWIAELTCDGDDYSLTEEALSNQTLANKIFDRWFARYQPAAMVCTRTLVGEPTEVVDEVTRRFNHALTNLQLEGLTEQEIEVILNRILDQVKHSSPQ